MGCVAVWIWWWVFCNRRLTSGLASGCRRAERARPSAKVCFFAVARCLRAHAPHDAARSPDGRAFGLPAMAATHRLFLEGADRRVRRPPALAIFACAGGFLLLVCPASGLACQRPPTKRRVAVGLGGDWPFYMREWVAAGRSLRLGGPLLKCLDCFWLCRTAPQLPSDASE